jgi:uncharacterized protein (TIGR00369 family)
MIYDMIKQQMMNTLPFAKTCGICIDEIGAGTSRVSMPEDPRLNNHLGSHHAGAIFTLAETASGAAMAGGFADLIMGLRPVAKEARIQYLKVSQGSTHAKARVPGDIAALKQVLQSEGKVAFPVEVEVMDASDTVVATIQVEWHLSMKR